MGNASVGRAHGALFLSRDSADGVQDTPMELGAGLREVPARLYVLSPAPIATTSHQASTGVVCTGSKGQKVMFNTQNIVFHFFFNFICYWVGKQKQVTFWKTAPREALRRFQATKSTPMLLLMVLYKAPLGMCSCTTFTCSSLFRFDPVRVRGPTHAQSPRMVPERTADRLEERRRRRQQW